MTECNGLPLTFSSLGRKKICADFGGGHLTSDGGALLLRQIDKRIGLIDALAACMSDLRDPAKTIHDVRTLTAHLPPRAICGLTDRLGFQPEQVHLAGTLVLYNNMLQSLYTSQIVTMGFATLSLMGTYVVLFRSVRIAIIAICPNLLAISCVLGVMGWLGIPLDMMTITIAAIGVCLADDETIHYIRWSKHEAENCHRAART